MTQEFRIVKGTAQNVSEAIQMIVVTGFMFYLFRPDLREKHCAAIRRKVEKVSHWVSVQHTIASIRNLPEVEQL